MCTYTHLHIICNILLFLFCNQILFFKSIFVKGHPTTPISLRVIIHFRYIFINNVVSNKYLSLELIEQHFDECNCYVLNLNVNY